MAPHAVVVMGVSGSGKTTVGRLLAERLGWHYQEGDALHPATNIAKMQRAIPLTDEDRWPWLRAIAAVIEGWRVRGEHGVVTCSALKRAYRDLLIGGRTDVALVYLRGTQEQIAWRMAARQGHYMPLALLESQFATLEEPQADEHPIVAAIDGDPEVIAAGILPRLA